MQIKSTWWYGNEKGVLQSCEEGKRKQEKVLGQSMAIQMGSAVP